MKAMLAPIVELAEYDEIIRTLSSHKALALSGCVESQKLHMAYGLGQGYSKKILITYDELRARELYEEYRFYDKNVVLFPAKDLIFFQADIHGNELTRQRIHALRNLVEKEDITVITTFDSLLTPQITLDKLLDNVLQLSVGSLVNEHAIATKLVRLGYTKNYQVESAGQFSIRGGILDIFDLTEENPYRIELWGDEVDSIRSFDVLSQRSVEKLEQITIFPATELILTGEELEKGIRDIERDTKKQVALLREQFLTEEAHRLHTQISQFAEEARSLGLSGGGINLEPFIRYFYKDLVSFLEYFDPEDSLFILDEPARILEHTEAVSQEFEDSMTHRLEKGYILPKQTQLLYEVGKIASKLQAYGTVMLSTLEQHAGVFACDKRFDMQAKNIAPYNNSFESLVKDIKHYRKDKYRIILFSGSRTRAMRLSQDLQEQDITAFYSENPERELAPSEVMVCYGRIKRGFEYPLLKFAVISESDIFGTEKKKKKKRKSYGGGQRVQDFHELKVGDYVVHESHGLGVYKGIEKVEVEKITKDYLKIEYRDGGILYIPATGLDVIQKYASADAKPPKLNKLGGTEWSKTTAKVKTAVNVVAEDLVKLYATRSMQGGYQYGPDTVWQREFEELFPYEETEDQLNAIEATKADMESTKIMDRLVCGDVGYGKTEVAIRAAFKAIQEGKQVVYLVPTTILAQQHYNTFVQRMKDFPVRVDLMSRFRTPSEQKKTVEDLKKGFVDIVIGTHRVLSKDVQFKSLGLLIIDEEQRFGVAHKEKIKKLKENVDVLTLTATPIPRTLHMSLIGVRDMSLLEEAPEDRLPIQTFVCEHNDEMVREAIARELSRGGQVYYVYNRVTNIADVAAKIQEIVPEANVAFAHGQMKEHELERIMYDFVNGEIDILVTTTIIETGLDIPNANTIIIQGSENMGLAQLYQLRGRVGRSNRTAYAFLMYKRDKLLSEVAEKRLSAIRDFTDLGSGYKIAMRDLEIRGAGNLLGTTQHGHLQAVGYEMYCKLLSEAVHRIQGNKVTTDFSTVIDLDVDAYIPGFYIVNEVQKLDIYKRITGIETVGEAKDMMEELLDRFGEVPKSVENLLRIALIRTAAHRVYIQEIKGGNGIIKIVMKPDADILVQRIPELLSASQNRLSFDPKGVPTFTYRYQKTGVVEKDEMILLDLTEGLLAEGFSLLIAEDTK